MNRLIVTDSAAVVDAGWLGLIYGFYADIRWMNGLVFSTSGPIVDPALGIRVGTLDVGGTVATDPLSNRAFFMWGNELSAVDGTTLAVIGTEQIIGVPPLDQPYWYQPALYRWGRDGFAYRTPEGIVIFRSGLAVP